MSPFHDTFGYYADGVVEATAVLPDGWKERLIRVENPNTGGITGWCLEVHDLLVSKYAAGREKDLLFCSVIATAGLADAAILEKRLAVTALDPAVGTLIWQWIRRDYA